MSEVPERIWIDPEYGDYWVTEVTWADPAKTAYIPYIREPEQAIVVSEKAARAVMGWVVASVKDNGWCDVDRAIALLRGGQDPDREKYRVEGT